MRFPVNATRQKRCPVCKASGPGTNPPGIPRPETASLGFAVWHPAGKGPAGPVTLGGDLFLSWDAGVCKHPMSRASLGATVRAARLQAPRTGEGFIPLQFCSIACLRKFLLSAVDELDQRAAAIGPQVKADRKRAGVAVNDPRDEGRVDRSQSKGSQVLLRAGLIRGPRREKDWRKLETYHGRWPTVSLAIRRTGSRDPGRPQ